MAREDKRLKRRIRNSYFISTVSIAMVLFLLGSVCYLILNALDVTNRLRESIAIHVMLKDGLEEGKLAELRKSIESQMLGEEPLVRSVEFLSKEAAAEQFKEETGDDFSEFIDFNPLPDSFEVSLTAVASEAPETVTGFVRDVEKMSGVTEVVYQKTVVEQIGRNLGKLNLVLMLFGSALLVISLILLNNTIRMTIINKRQIINTMKLVGANPGFIMKPFLGSAVRHGAYAGLIATTMFLLLYFGLHEGLPDVRLLRGSFLLLSIVGGMIVGGVIISLIFTTLAVNKTIRK